jgi:hypothetical protein
MEVDSHHDLQVKKKEICSILSQDFKLRHRKIHYIQQQANSFRSMVLRQRFAREMIKLLQNKVRIINVDETILGESNFVRKAWRGSTYSIS